MAQIFLNFELFLVENIQNMFPNSNVILKSESEVRFKKFKAWKVIMGNI